MCSYQQQRHTTNHMLIRMLKTFSDLTTDVISQLVFAAARP